MAASLLAVAAALVVLPSASGPVSVFAFAALIGVGGGVCTVVFFAVWPAAFGRAHLGNVQGAAQVLTVCASALGPVLLAIGERGRGSYSATFLMMTPLVLVLALACVAVRLPRAADASGTP
jgi:hypothetical protein